jgi:type VI secretion system protein ImpL
MLLVIASVFVLACLLAVVWVGGWFLGLTLLVKIVLTGTLLGLAGMILILSYVAKILAATRLERGVLQQAAKQAEAARPDRRKDILALQQQARQAIQSLKRSRLARGGKAALYALPWYVIVGPPGAGKTTAIRHSGLEFPLEQAGGASAFRGTGGTRNCDWWFTNEAILLDTAGRYATDAGDQEEWFAFLDLLRRTRGRKPIDGLLVALPLGDLASIGEHEADAIAQRMRARIDEVLDRLKMLVPVYVIFTKVDLVAGFSEFWNDLAKSERGQIWGMSFPATTNTEPQAAFAEEFEGLVGTLHARLLRRLGNERSVLARRALFSFPVEFAPFQPSLTHFLASLFRTNPYQETPLLRAVFFTSGTQNVRPMSRVIASMVSAFGLRMPQTENAPVESRSYFLTDAFRRVMFRDRTLGGRTVAERRRQLAFRLGIAALAVLVSVTLALPALVTSVRNRELVRSTASIAGRIAAAPWADSAALDRSAPLLDEARARLQQLASWRKDGAPVQLRWGMYTGDELYDGLRDVYARAVSVAVTTPAKADLEDRLRSMDSGPIRTPENFNRDFDTLKLYLMLASAEHMDAAWAAPRLVRRWSLTQHAHVKDEEALALPHVAYSFELLKDGELAPFTADQALVARARAILAQVPQMDRLYESLVRDANTEVPSIRREMIFYGSCAPFVQSRKGVKVDGAYTKQGWLRVRALLGEQRASLASEQWVLGESGIANAEDLIDKLRQLYFERYRNAWRDFLSDLQVQDPGNAEIALDEINALSEPEWPYLRLIRTISDNVTLEMQDPNSKLGLAEKAVDKVAQVLDAGSPVVHEVSPVEVAFRPILAFGLPPTIKNPGDIPPPTGLSQYEALLSKVVGSLTDIRDAEAGADPRKLGDVFQDVFRSTSALLTEQDGFTRPLIGPLLMNPVTLAWSNVVKDAGAAAGASWETSVWQKWHDKLEGKYPFVNSQTDATLDDFLDFFRPGDGVLWSFYDESLKATLDRNGSSFAPARRFRSSINYTSEFLDVCLRRGADFTTVLFPPKSDHAAVSFDLNVHSVSPSIAQITFEVDGASRTYRNEPEQWLTVQWPGKGQHGARLRVKGAGGLDEEISRPGDFGLFRLLDLAEVKPGRAGGKADGSPTLVATWDLHATRDKTVVNFDLRPARNENPLVPGYFSTYKCPRVIAVR